MGGITVEIAREKLNTWLEAEEALATSQSYTMGTMSLTRADLSGEALQKAISEKIRAKDAKQSLVGNMVSEGTTPRNLTDLIGSLCDLTSGSGDKGTPIIYIQGYFDNYTNE